VADFVVELGALVVVVVGAAVVGVETGLGPAEPVEVAVVPDVVAVLVVAAVLVVVEATVLSADAVVPGISLEMTRPSAVVIPMARMVTALDTPRTRARALSRRAAASGPRAPVGLAAEPAGPRPLDDEVLMVGMSPCEPLGPRTAG
jgi:hypothetical protein